MSAKRGMGLSQIRTEGGVKELVDVRDLLFFYYSGMFCRQSMDNAQL